MSETPTETTPADAARPSREDLLLSVEAALLRATESGTSGDVLALTLARERLEASAPGMAPSPSPGGPREVCERCHRENPIAFTLPDAVWQNAVQGKYAVLCPMCLDELATGHGIAVWAHCTALRPADPGGAK